MLKLAIEPRTIQHACFERHESFVRCIPRFFKTASCDDKNMGSSFICVYTLNEGFLVNTFFCKVLPVFSIRG